MNKSNAISKPFSSARSALAVVGACAVAQSTALGASFGDDLAFVKSHLATIVLSDQSGQAKVVLAPSLQGRVLTSTAAGDDGRSFGWINRDLIAAHRPQPHFNAFGGEDRFWLGPEGGQFSIFFAKGAPFNLEHWFTPAPLDTEAFDVVHQSNDRAEFARSFALTNYSGTRFDLSVRRTVRLLDSQQAWQRLGRSSVSGISLVAFESVNQIQNAGLKPWEKETGLLSIWILGMFTPSPTTTIVVPIEPGSESELGKKITADYFGSVPADRLVLKSNAAFFRGDGKFRSKIGISPRRCKSVLGSFDSANHVLTLVQFNLPSEAKDYVNSLWQIQTQPFEGDAANSYNDGPATPGAKPLGPFYEMESSSPAAALAPGASLEHIHRTLHLTGPDAELDPVARAVLGVSLEEISHSLARP